MALVFGQSVFVTSYTDNKVVRMNWPRCDRVTQSVYVHRPRGIAMHDGTLVVACYGNPMGTIVVLDPFTLTLLSRFETARPRGIAVWNDLLVITQVNTGRLVLVDKSGRVHKVLSGFRKPRDVCIHDDVAFVASTDSKCVVSVHLVTLVRRIVAPGCRPNGVATNGRTLVVTDWNSGRVMSYTLDGVLSREFQARTPCMVAWSGDTYIVCDHDDHCLYVFPR